MTYRGALREGMYGVRLSVNAAPVPQHGSGERLVRAMIRGGSRKPPNS